jgi:hypothetical protein
LAGFGGLNDDQADLRYPTVGQTIRNYHLARKNRRITDERGEAPSRFPTISAVAQDAVGPLLVVSRHSGSAAPEREKLITIGAKVVRYRRNVTWQWAQGSPASDGVPRRLGRLDQSRPGLEAQPGIERPQRQPEVDPRQLQPGIQAGEPGACPAPVRQAAEEAHLRLATRKCPKGLSFENAAACPLVD